MLTDLALQLALGPPSWLQMLSAAVFDIPMACPGSSVTQPGNSQRFHALYGLWCLISSVRCQIALHLPNTLPCSGQPHPEYMMPAQHALGTFNHHLGLQRSPGIDTRIPYAP